MGYNEFLTAFKETEKNKKLKRKFETYCVGNFNECKSISIEDNINIKDHMEDFLKFQFDIQLVREFDNITLYTDDDTYFLLDWQYNADDNVFEVTFDNVDGKYFALKRSLEDVDEQLEYEFNSREFDEDATNVLDEFIAENKEDRVEMYEYDYVCEMIEKFVNECLLNHK